MHKKEKAHPPMGSGYSVILFPCISPSHQDPGHVRMCLECFPSHWNWQLSLSQPYGVQFPLHRALTSVPCGQPSLLDSNGHFNPEVGRLGSAE